MIEYLLLSLISVYFTNMKIFIALVVLVVISCNVAEAQWDFCEAAFPAETEERQCCNLCVAVENNNGVLCAECLLDNASGVCAYSQNNDSGLMCAAVSDK